MSADVKQLREGSDLLTVDEACRKLRIGRSTIYELCAAGEIRHVKIGRLKRFRQEALDEFIASHEVGASPSPPPAKKAGR
jgi:excisionase family DNA binding protein